MVMLSTAIRTAATVIVLREQAGHLEVLLMRRNRNAPTSAQAFVFPGGMLEPDEVPATAAARELFEEAGILLARNSEQHPVAGTTAAALYRNIVRNQRSNETMAHLHQASVTLATETLAPWAEWITPSVEAKRFRAHFFVAALPVDQAPSVNEREMVELRWVTAEDALAHARTLHLPPPQIRTFYELLPYRSIDEVFAAAAARQTEPHPILPRGFTAPQGPALALPWDPAYLAEGIGDSAPYATRPAWAHGPSRFVRLSDGWHYQDPAAA